MINQPEIYKGDIKLLEYVISILNDSRSKKQAANRLHGLLTLRREQESNCLNYSQDMINEYISQQEKKK